MRGCRTVLGVSLSMAYYALTLKTSNPHDTFRETIGQSIVTQDNSLLNSPRRQLLPCRQ